MSVHISWESFTSHSNCNDEIPPHFTQSLLLFSLELLGWIRDVKNSGVGGNHIYWCMHEQRFQRYLQNKFLAFTKKTPLNKDFMPFIWPLNLANLKKQNKTKQNKKQKQKKHPFFLKIKIFRPINGKHPLSVLLKKKKKKKKKKNTPFHTFFFHMCTPIYIMSGPLGEQDGLPVPGASIYSKLRRNLTTVWSL